MYDSIVTAYRKNGFKGVIRHALQLAVGMQHYEASLNTLTYFMDHYFNISDFPKATGALRMVQLGDVMLLRIVDAVCRKNELTYWIDAGTCLGAIRHRGFIPWDDDMDICMIREDYERAVPIIKNELKRYEIDVEEKQDEPIAHTGIGYQHKKTGLWIDLFPFEYSTIKPNDVNGVMEHTKKCLKYQKVWNKKRFNYSREKMFEMRQKYLPEICDKTEARSIIHCPEWGPRPMVFDIDDILPPQKREFEGYQIPTPHNADKYLSVFYGNYMSFPKSGVMSHGDDRGGLSAWAESSGTDMNDVLCKLNEILTKIE